MDDTLIGGRDVEHHDQIFRKVIERAIQYNLKLNYDKCEIRQPQVSYVGHLITKNGIKPHPSKVRARVDMPKPKDIEGVRRFLGLVQYLAKFIPNMSKVNASLRVLVKSETEFMWHHEQENSFSELKRLCSQQPVLAFLTLTNRQRFNVMHLRMGWEQSLFKQDVQLHTHLARLQTQRSAVGR